MHEQLTSSLEVCELLRRYRKDLSLRAFPCNDEGDWNLRWTQKEIERVDKAMATLQSVELRATPADQVLVSRSTLIQALNLCPDGKAAREEIIALLGLRRA